MYIETQYILDQFTTNFIENMSGPIIIYGTGLNTQRLLEKINDDRIVGLMDDKKTGQVLWGKKVLSYEEVAKIKDVIIVIIARNAVINVIYRRIESFCKENEIPVFNIHGKDLSKKQKEDETSPCFLLKEEELRKKIEEHDIVSFDIFDTLLMRKILRPRDIFEVMNHELGIREYDFCKERIEAEDSFEKGYNPNIYEIYECIGKKLDIQKKEVRELLESEIETEKSFLTKRVKMCEIFRWAIQQGKEVYLVSDMYFTREILEDILKSFDICDYKDIFISCEYRKTKQEGLFDIYKGAVSGNSSSKKGKKYLHIGDNFFSDIVAAQYAGIEAYQIYSAGEMLESGIYSKSLQHCKTLEDNIVLASFAERAFNNPFQNFEKNGKLIIEKTEDIIGLFIAPVIYKYVLWLMQKVQKENCNLLVFPSRDGYIIQQIFYKIKAKNPDFFMPEDVYLYTSRRAAMIASVENEEDIQEIKNFIFVSGKAELLKERFGISNPEDQVVSDAFLVKKCKEEKKTYKAYLEQAGLYQKNKIAFMDFVAMGTVQAAMEKILGKELIGFYFLRRVAEDSKLKNMKCHSLYQPAGDFQIEANIYRFYYFLESIITSYEPTFWGISESGDRVFYEEKRSKEVIDLLQKIHNEILRYSDEMLCLLPKIELMTGPVDVYDGLLGYFSADYSVLENDEISKLINIDEFMGKIVTDLNR